MLSSGQVIKALASCHSLTRINGEITGDPLDVKMFESTKWDFLDDHLQATSFEQITPVAKQHIDESLVFTDEFLRVNETEIAIVKQFTFSSALLRMSVLCKTLRTDYMEVFTKGAPEKIKSLCRENTSISSLLRS